MDPTQGHKIQMERLNATEDTTTLGHCIHQLFEFASERCVDHVGLICAAEELSFRELNVRANRLAHALASRGVGRGDLVVVALGRSVELVVALLAVLKTGAAYVPVDMSFPLERISQMMDDATPKFIITRTTTFDALSRWKDLCLSIDEIHESDSNTTEPDNLHVNVQAEDLAYVIYTSGSTGRPKGVEISHGAACNLLLSMQREPGCDGTDRLLAVTTVSFDIAVLELILPLISGATTIIAQSHEVADATALLGLIERHQITIMQATPATWQLLLDSGWRGKPRLKKTLCGGEALSRRLADRLLQSADSVWNMYGPTEATVWASTWRVVEDEDVVIGHPIANTQFYVLEADLSPAALNSPGELYIGGAGVARGYHNLPELTKSRFVKNPFHGGIMYQTGDLARFSSPEKLNVLGRADDQVKIRGYRIELGDIEAALTDHQDVSKAVVIRRDERLIAYCIREQASPEVRIEDSVAEWAGAWDHAYGTGSEGADAILNIAGWRNSYDDTLLSTDEMRDWQTSSVQQILSYSPKRVAEIGSGTGMMLFSIAPHCSFYHAMDASNEAVEFTRRNLGKLSHVLCEQRRAHALPFVEEPLDNVIINSVSQYFQNIDYLISVIEWASKSINKGRIYLGDVRNLKLLDVFHGDIMRSRTNGKIPYSERASRAEESARAERELVIAPEFFADLPSLYPQISRVDIALRDGLYDNEMTRYRYDVTIHIRDEEPIPTPTRELNWQDAKLNVDSLRDNLSETDGLTLRLSDIPNGRLREVHSYMTDISSAESLWVAPHTLKDIAAEAALEIALLPSRSGDIWKLDALLWRAGANPDLRLRPPETIDRPMIKFANVPKVGETSKPTLSRILRSWLADRLPAYMVPAFFVEVEEFPLTPNAKIDRKALPDPVEKRDAVTKPTTELESDILGIWSDVLGHDHIDVCDSFFQIGGDSLRVVRVQMQLEKLLGRSVLSAKLFEHYTIKALAAHLTSTDKPSPKPAPLRQTSHDSEDIGIISMSCRLPGGITTPEEYWDLLENGRDAITDVPKDRWNAEAIYDSDPEANGKSYCRQGGFVDSIDSFDAALFGISPREARSLDPTQYMMLETCWEGFERAGYTTEHLRGSQTGVFVGISNIPPYQGDAHTKGLDELDGYAGTGSSGGTMSGRVSYTLGLEGPSMTVDTACSSSLVTTHMACTALRQGECDMAVSAGISLMFSPGVHVEFSRLRGMAPDGRCRAFSSDTQGTGWSEGSTAVVLKRLSDAQRDNDPVLAVLRGTAVNHGGRSASLTTPSGPAQKRLIQRAIANSRLQPNDIDYIEAHGTGTKLGDPIEGAALAEVFGNSNRTEPLWIGSAKSNLGHTQAAAGLVGMLKVVLSLQHNTLPQTLHIAELTPAVDWRSANMALVEEKRVWSARSDRIRRAGISAFGIGGTNAHAIVEEAPKSTVQTVKSRNSESLPSVLPLLLSGNTEAAVRQQAKKLQAFLSGRTNHLSDVAYSLATTRNHFLYRLALMAKDEEDLFTQLAAVANTAMSRLSLATQIHNQSEDPRLAMLFTGQGSQLAGMGKEFNKHYPIFREALEEIVARFTELERPLLDVMWASEDSDDAALLQRTDYAQPALFAFEVALWRLWSSWGVKPNFLLGHSIGELAAAHVAGVMDLSDACRLVAARGRLMQMQGQPGQGKMISLEASAAEVTAAIKVLGIGSKFDIAGHNMPTQTVASGDADAIELLEAHFISQSRKSKILKVSHAFHSHHMDGMLAEFKAVAETVRFQTPTIPIVSGLTGQLATPGQLEQPGYWVRQARHAVRFADGIQTLADRDINIFLEIGPQPVLSGMGAGCLAANAAISKDANSVAWLRSVTPKKDATSTIQQSLAELHVRNANVDWLAYFKPFGCQCVELPTYAFQRDFTRPPTSSTADSHEETSNSIKLSPHEPDRDSDLCDELMVADPEKHTEIVLQLVQETVAGVLGFSSPDSIDIDMSCKDLGVDSLTAALMRSRLTAMTGLNLSNWIVFEHPNIRSLSQSLLYQLQDSWSDSSSNTPGSGGSTPTTTASDSVSSLGNSIDDVLIIDGDSSSTIGPETTQDEKRSRKSPITPLHRVLSPPLGLNPPNTSSLLFPSALEYFNSLPWCSRLISEKSPTSSLLPGHGKAIPFIPQCFNPASSRHDQFIGKSLSRNSISGSETSPIRHMLSLFRPSDASHLKDSSRHIPHVASLYALGDGTSGYEGILHGGLTSTLLDESISIVHEINTALGKTDSVFSAISVTASLNVKFLAPVATTEKAVCVTAWVEKIQGRHTTMKAELTNSKGVKLAEAESVFVAVDSVA